jgi:two-component system, OmpR family, phosphate regulon response regulator PhoB
MLAANQRILVVEENPEQRDVMLAVLEHLGHACFGASTSDEAMTLMDSIAPTVVLVEIKPFEEQVALGLGRRLRQAGGASPLLVAVLAWAATDDEERTSPVGFDTYVVRPLTIGTLRTLMRDVEKYRTEVN